MGTLAWISAATVDKVGDPVNNGTEIDVVEHRVVHADARIDLVDRQFGVAEDVVAGEAHVRIHRAPAE